MVPAEQTAPNELVTRRSLWLSIRLGRENWLFEIEPDEERAIVVGSLLRAHIRINRRDVAPVHFHFEREQERIRLCPAYGADLYVNGTPISGPHELEAHATIAFAGMDLEAYVCDIEPNILEQLDLCDWTTQDLPDCGTMMSLADGAEVTRAIQRPSIAREAAADATKKFSPLCDSYLVPACEAQGAVRTIPILSIDTAPPDFSGDALPSAAPVCFDSGDATIAPPQLLFTRIGLAARSRPLAATLACACGALVLALAMLAADRTMSRDVHEVGATDVRASTSLAAPAVQLVPHASLSGEPLADVSGPEITVAPPPAASALARPSKRVPTATDARARRPASAPPRASTRAVEADPRVRSGI